MTTTRTWLALGAIGAALASAPAWAQDNPACAQFQEPLAYNACLAKHGGMTRAAGAATGRNKSAGGSARTVTRGRVHGRVEMEFAIEPKRR